MAEPGSVISSGSVRGAYLNSRGLKDDGNVALDTTATDAPSFAEALRNAAADAVETVRGADATARQGMRGQADTQSVVEATIALESTVKIAVSMRDKFVQAYQEVLRMPI
ncbi:MAG: flagellar hook-basal body complex protein FliE [Tranquillimonas sp.]|jgi:flagellar hook-basal body complex protein FliE